MKKQNETQLGKAVDAYLLAIGAFPVRINSGGVISTYKGKKRFIKFNNQPGCSDRLVCLPDGRFMALELKVPGNDPTPEQLNFLDQIGMRRGLGMCVWTLEQLVEAMKGMGYDKISP